MALWNTLDFATLQRSERWDSEFFSPNVLSLVEGLNVKQSRPLRSYVLSAQRGQAPAYSRDGVIPVIRTVNVRELEFSPTRQEFVSEQFYTKSSSGQIEKNDIVVTSTGVGTLGRVFCNLSNKSYFADGHITVLKCKPTTDVAFLAAVLQSKIGTMQFERWQRGSSGQIEIYPDDILNILIPVVPDALQSRVSDLWREAIYLVEQADNFYPEAEAELLQRLGWDDITAPQELFYSANFNKLNKAGRYDPEFYHPHYARLRQRIQERGGMTLKQLVTTLDKGTQPAFYTEEGSIIVVKSKDVSGRGVNWDSCERTSQVVWDDSILARLRSNDVVINATGRGTLGRAEAITSLPQKAVAAVDLVICRPNLHAINPTYLALFLNSPLGLAQSEQFQTGSSGQLHLYPQHFEQFLVFVPRNADGKIDLSWQQFLADKVLEASAAKVRARNKLEQAKQLVEQAVNL